MAGHAPAIRFPFALRRRGQHMPGRSPHRLRASRRPSRIRCQEHLVRRVPDEQFPAVVHVAKACTTRGAGASRAGSSACEHVLRAGVTRSRAGHGSRGAAQRQGLRYSPSIQAFALAIVSLKSGRTLACAICSPNSSCAASSACGSNSSGTMSSVTSTRPESVATCSCVLSRVMQTWLGTSSGISFKTCL